MTDSVTVLAGVFNGSPVANNIGDPQLQQSLRHQLPAQRRRAGDRRTAIQPTRRPARWSRPTRTDPLARTYKIGVWYDSESFADLRYDNTGLSLANPASDGIPASHRGDYAFYAVADQMIWRFADDPDRNINVFVRPMFTPLQDRNLIDFSLNAGLTMHEPFFGRDDDTAGVGIGFARVSDSVTGLDLDTAFYNPGVYSPVRDKRDRSSRRPINIRSRHGGRFSLTFNTSSIPAAASSIRTIPTQKIKNEAGGRPAHQHHLLERRDGGRGRRSRRRADEEVKDEGNDHVEPWTKRRARRPACAAALSILSVGARARATACSKACIITRR